MLYVLLKTHRCAYKDLNKFLLARVLWLEMKISPKYVPINDDF